MRAYAYYTKSEGEADCFAKEIVWSIKMKKTVVAVIGCGRISQRHIPALHGMENVRIKYICDLIESKAKDMQAKYPKVENVITDYQVALADQEVEAVWVLTPNYLHYTITMEALKAGKHVFCEKPVTVSYALSKEMADEAEKQGKMLDIGVCNRYSTPVEMLEQWNREGKFGSIYHVYCAFRGFRNIPGLGGAFTTKAESGGGVLIDWGVHFFDLIMYVLGGAKVQTVTCDAYSELAKDMKAYKYKSMWAEDTSNIENGTNDVDDFISGYVRTDKASISFNGAWAQNVDIPELYVDFLGDKGGARLDYQGHFSFWSADTLEQVRPEPELPNMFEREDAAFVEAIDSGVKTKNNVAGVLETMKLLDALYASAEQKKELKF